MGFQMELPSYEDMLNNAYANITAPASVNFETEVKKNLDTYGRYSYTLCCLWRDSKGIPLNLVPWYINKIPRVEDYRSYRLVDINDYYARNKEAYDAFDTLPRARKGLTCRMVAATDMMLQYVTGATSSLPPLGVNGVEADFAMLHFLCRRAVTGEMVADYEGLMGVGIDD